MHNKLMKNIKNSKTKIFIMYFLILIISSSIISLYFHKEIADINSLNILLNIIVIPACVVYYKKNKNILIYIYLLIYISTLIENSYVYLAGIESKIIILLFTYRTLLLMLTIFKNSVVVRWMEINKKMVIILTTVLNFMILEIDKFITNFISVKIGDIILKILVLLSYIIIVKIFINAKKRKDFVEIIFVLGIIIMGIRLWIMYILEKSIILNFLIPSNEILFFFTYSSILIGLFIENIFMINENEKLNEDVREITNNIEELKELENLRIEFFANLSHELKTPINIIYSSLQLLEVKKSINDREFIDTYNKYEPTLKQNCFRMIRLTNNLVDITKINAGFIKLNFQNVDIVKLVEEITVSVVCYVEQKNIDIVFDTLIEEHIIKCDVDAIERIILNLLANSIKFSNKDGSIVVFMELKDEYIIIKVKDDGIGINKEDKKNIFDVFIQADKALNREKEGSGIGLSLVKSLVELHGGTVYLGDVSVGTEVIIKLPNVKMEEESEKDVCLNNYDTGIVSKIKVEFSDIYSIK